MRPTTDFGLVAIDLDGTLLSSQGEISDMNRSAIAACTAKGVAIAIVTGRRFPSAVPYATELAVEPFIVANSGALIKESASGPILRRRLLGVDIAEMVVRLAERAGHAPIVHDGPDAEGHLILSDSTSSPRHLARYLHQAHPPPTRVRSIRIERDPVQIGFAASIDEVRALSERLTDALASRRLAAHVIRTEYPREDLALLDVLSAEASKASALSFLAHRLGLPLSRTMAIGDNWNDEDMLETAGLGVIMANASPELRAKGFAGTASNDDAGVAQALERYILAPERATRSGQKNRG